MCIIQKRTKVTSWLRQTLLNMQNNYFLLMSDCNQRKQIFSGFVGSKSTGDEWATMKIKTWEQSLKILSAVAKTQPQAAYVAVSKSLQNEWSYLQRVFADCETLFSPLCMTLIEDFIPSLVGNQINETDFNIIEKQTRLISCMVFKTLL